MQRRTGQEEMTTGGSIILDSEAIIGLAKGALFECLKTLFAEVYITPSVQREVVTQGAGRVGQEELRQAIQEQWVIVCSPEKQTLGKITPTLELEDRELVALAEEVDADFVLTRDEQIQRELTRLGRVFLTAGDIILLAKKYRLTSLVKPVLDLMKQRGYGISDEAYEEYLREAGELP